MKCILFSLVICFYSLVLYAQNETYKADIKKSEVTNVNKGAKVDITKAEVVNIKYGNIIIGKLIINEASTNSKLILDTIVQLKDIYGIWHLIVNIKSQYGNDINNANFKIKFSRPVINVMPITAFGFGDGQKLDSAKKNYTFSYSKVTLSTNNILQLVINSEGKQQIEISGISPKEY